MGVVGVDKRLTLLATTATILTILLVYSVCVAKANEEGDHVFRLTGNAAKPLKGNPIEGFKHLKKTTVNLVKPPNASGEKRVIPPSCFGLAWLTANGTAVKLDGKEEAKAGVEAFGTYFGLGRGVRHVTVDYVIVNVNGETYVFDIGKAYIGRRILLLTATERTMDGRQVSLWKLVLTATLKAEKWPPAEEAFDIPIKCKGILIVMGPWGKAVWRLNLEGTLKLEQGDFEQIIQPLPKP